MALLGIPIPITAARLLSDIDIHGKKVGTHEMHITILLFEDDFPISEIAKSLETTYDVVSKIDPFTIKIKKISCFPPKEGKPHPIIALVESEELHDLCKKLRRKFNKDGIDFDKTFKKYNPHITLSYADKEIKEFKIDPVEIVVQELVLLGGNHGDTRLFITFPLKSPEKHGALLRKCKILEKWGEDLTPQEYEKMMLHQMKKGDPESIFAFITENKDILKRKKKTDLIYLAKAAHDRFRRTAPRAFYKWAKRLSQIDPEFFQPVNDAMVSEIIDARNKAQQDPDMWYWFINDDLVPLEDFLSDDQIRESLKIFWDSVNFEDPNKTQKWASALTGFLASRRLKQNLVLRLLQWIDPKTFAEHYHTQSYQRVQERSFFKQDKYTTDDIIYFLEIPMVTHVQYRELRHIIDHATPAAKNILQRVLWRSLWGFPKYFVLDESMKPLGLEYDKNSKSYVQIGVEIPLYEGIGRAENIDDQKWRDLFADYQIVAYPGTFASLS